LFPIAAESTTAGYNLGLTLVLKVGVMTEQAARRVQFLRYFWSALLFSFNILNNCLILGWLPFDTPKSASINDVASVLISHFIAVAPIGIPMTLCTEASVTGINPLPGNTNAKACGS
jgi:hypothetical protein